MLLVFIDEASWEKNNENSSESRFLVSSAVLIDSHAALKFSAEVEKLRHKAGFKNDRKFKFALSDKPDHISKDVHAESKCELLALAEKFGVRTITYCALHKIIDSQDHDTYLNRAIDAILTKTQQFYNEQGLSSGFYCFADRHSRAGLSSYLVRRFQERNTQQKDGFNTPDMVGTGQVWDGTSHLSSLCDIITGSFNYIVNTPDRDIAGKAMIKLLKPLVWGEEAAGTINVVGRGLLFRPETPQVEKYKKYYDETKDRIVGWANS